MRAGIPGMGRATKGITIETPAAKKSPLLPDGELTNLSRTTS